MGRHYDGDISGKFWFGVQDSGDAEHFGAYEIEREIINPTQTEDEHGNIIYDEAVAGIAVWATCAKEESAEYVATPHFL